MTDLIEKLTDFGFSKTDALVYITLLKHGKCSGYKIAKEISLSRSSVYSSIDNLYESGYIYLSDGSTKEYTAKSPSLIFSEISERVNENISFVKKELSKMVVQQEPSFVHNITGIDNLIREAKELINKASVEIYLNSNFDLFLFEDELNQAIERGVRIIYFSFHRMDVPNEKIEHYYRWESNSTNQPSNRFMMVVDMKSALNFSDVNGGVGLYTNHDLFIMITSEHIHNDIYLTKHSETTPEVEFKINTIHEQTVM